MIDDPAFFYGMIAVAGAIGYWVGRTSGKHLGSRACQKYLERPKLTNATPEQTEELDEWVRQHRSQVAMELNTD